MKSIQEDIKKGQFKQVYLLYGEEAYLRKNYRDKLKKVLIPAEDSMNYHYFEGKGVPVNQVIDLAETMPFFADRRLIVIENSGLFSEASGDMADYIKELPDTVYFIFVESAVDKRGRLYKAVKEKGRAAEFAVQNEKVLIQWILSILKKENKKITERTMQIFLIKTGADMGNIDKELEKLLCYTLERDVITEEDVKAVCTVKTTNQIFEMIRLISENKQKKALNLYYDLLALKEPPMRILFLIARQFHLLLQVKEMQQLGFDLSDISKKIKLQSFIASKYVAQSKVFSIELLKEAVLRCVQYEEAVKTGKMNDHIAVEMLIVHNFSNVKT